jgi:hypothetical protein
MNDSIITADMKTHLKISALALVAVLAIVTIGFTARIDQPEIGTARAKNGGLVVKAGKLTQFTQRSGIEIR